MATPSLIVGVGASAGGLEAFSAILQSLPEKTGMAYVFVQHFDPSHRSLMPELLARQTSMKVMEAGDGVRVRPDRVYVIPPTKTLRIEDGRLRLGRRETGRKPPRIIDAFLQSLAKDQGERAAAVILSGTGSDGVQGTVAIRGAGGRTFAQDDESAKFNAMPHAAVASGAVEFIGDPASISQGLVEVAGRPPLGSAPSATNSDVPSELQGILEIVHRASGVDFAKYKRGTLERRIRRRMVATRSRNVKEYEAALRTTPVEVDALYRDLLINVTSFFRNGGTFEALQRRVVPHLLENRSPRQAIRIWVPGCSSGEEAYSMAILVLEAVKERNLRVPVQVFATDVSASAIEKARQGRYPKSIEAEVGRERLRRFFVRSDGGYQVSKEVRQCCVFATHDVTRDAPFSKIDIISCRNLMIYLGPELQARVIPTLHYALKTGGFLVLGPAESIGTFSNLFRAADRKQKIFERKPSSELVPQGFLPRSRDLAAGGPLAPLPAPVRSGADARAEADRLVLARFAPAGVIVNEDFEVLQFRGRTAPFLEHPPGEARLNVLKMARDGLVMGLRSVLERAKRKNRPARSKPLRLGPDDLQRQVVVEAVPLRSATGGRNFFVFFEGTPAMEASDGRQTRTAKGRNPSLNPRVQALEEELKSTKQYLQAVIDAQDSTNEQLQSANEEALSNNEELQSANEELETAQEELQSANEELTTLNEELENRNGALAVLYNDLNNLVNNINIAVVILSKDLRIRRFTPAAEKVLNLIASDIGRPLGNIRPNLEGVDLAALAEACIKDLEFTERQVRDRSGRPFMLRVRPYLTEESKIDGVVLTLVDPEGRGMNAEGPTRARPTKGPA